MTPERWARVNEVFGEAIERSGSARIEYIERACSGDKALRDQILQLLRTHDRSDAFIDRALVPAGLIKQAAAARSFREDQVIGGRFRIVRFLGEGGMGEVYEAEDIEMSKRIAVNTLLPHLAGDPRLAERFKQEIEMARRVAHPNVCRIFELWRDGDACFYTMEMLEGETLAQRLRRDGPMKPAEALRVLRQAVAGLQAAHEAGIVHRDFKPGNVMLCADRVVVMDFGLARVSAPSGVTLATTNSGQAIGTPAYMAPEQIEGKKAGPASDVYSLGVTIFEMLTGNPPYASESPLAMAAKKVRGDAPDLRQVSGIPPRWASVIARSLAVRPADRFPTARAVVEALEGRGRTWHVTGRTRRWAAVAIAFLILLAAAFWWYTRNPFHPAPEAVREYDRGVAALTEGATAKATDHLEKAVQIDSRYPLAHARLAQAYMDSDLIDKAQDQIIRLQVLIGGTRLPGRDKLLLDAVQKVVLRDYRDAASVFEKIVALTPERDRAGAWIDLAMAQQNGDLLEPAAVSYREAIAADSGNAAAHWRLGEVLLAANQVPESRAELARASEIFTRDGAVEGQIDVLIALGNVAARAGHPEEQERLLNLALGLAAAAPDPRHRLDVKLSLATNYFMRNRNTEAETIIGEEIGQARQANHEDLAARGMLALANAMLSRLNYTAAERAARQAIDLADGAGRRLTAASARIALASSLIRQGKAAEGLSYVEPALQFFKERNYGERYRAALQTKVDGLIDLHDMQNGPPLARELVAEQERAGEPRAIASARQRVATFMIMAGDEPGAIAMAAKIREGYLAIKNRNQVAMSFTSEALREIDMGRLDAARQAIGQARSLLPALDAKVRSSAQRRVGNADAVLAMAELRYSDAAALWAGPTAEPDPVLTPLSRAYTGSARQVAAELQDKSDFYSRLALVEVLLLLRDPGPAAKLAQDLVREGEPHEFASYVFRAALLWSRACQKAASPALARATAERDRLFQSFTATWTAADRSQVPAPSGHPGIVEPALTPILGTSRIAQ